AMADAEPRPLFPALKPFYDFVLPLIWPLIRIAAGWNLVVHAYGKLLRGPSAGAAGYTQLGFEPAMFFAWSSFLIEGLGGIGIILGLFTRFFAAAAAIELGVIFLAYWSNGFGWMNRGYEYVLLWGLVCFAIALRGGGPYSLDRKIGVEL
ncbi:MAG: DoxX family protein, partial [Xanthobacteraceae bacterium]